VIARVIVSIYIYILPGEKMSTRNKIYTGDLRSEALFLKKEQQEAKVVRHFKITVLCRARRCFQYTQYKEI
jgi:hypothetical protein